MQCSLRAQGLHLAQIAPSLACCQTGWPRHEQAVVCDEQIALLCLVCWVEQGLDASQSGVSPVVLTAWRESDLLYQLQNKSTCHYDYACNIHDE